MIISYITLLLIVNGHASPLDFGVAFKPIPVRLNVKELGFVAITTSVSNDLNIVIIVLCFSYFF